LALRRRRGHDAEVRRRRERLRRSVRCSIGWERRRRV
jgi:hypothetical protein